MVGQKDSNDSGLAALVMLLHFHGVAADAEQIRHRIAPGAAIGVYDMLRYAKSCGIRARCLASNLKRLEKTPLPAIASRRGRRFFILAKAANNRAVIQDPLERQPTVVDRGALEAMWDGRLVLLARRASLTDLSRRFDITWFLQAMHKYRRLLGEVLVASLFLQVFALVT